MYKKKKFNISFRFFGSNEISESVVKVCNFFFLFVFHQSHKKITFDCLEGQMWFLILQVQHAHSLDCGPLIIPSLFSFMLLIQGRILIFFFFFFFFFFLIFKTQETNIATTLFYSLLSAYEIFFLP